MATPKNEEIKIRVPSAMKTAIQALANSRFTSESEIAREALLEYLAKRNVPLQEPAPAPAAAAPQRPLDELAVPDPEVIRTLKALPRGKARRKAQ